MKFGEQVGPGEQRKFGPGGREWRFPYVFRTAALAVGFWLFVSRQRNDEAVIE
jgi:hypothetical protein